MKQSTSGVSQPCNATFGGNWKPLDWWDPPPPSLPFSSPSCLLQGISGVQELVEWCDNNFLKLNVSKTKELVVDFRAAPTDTEPITVKGQSVKTVSAYKYVGTVIDDKLSWTPSLPPPPPHTHAHARHARMHTNARARARAHWRMLQAGT